MSKYRLFEPMSIGSRELRNRIVMAPLTRGRANDDGTANDLMGTYYAQRSSAGLIISEGIVVSPQGVSYPGVPGIWTDEQALSWRPIVNEVHRRGGVMFAQLWHVGRQSHSSVQPDGGLPIAPSAVPITGDTYYRKPERIPFETPRALSVPGIRDVIAQFVDSARRARAVGFDGVELHAANGYLIDQFLNSGSNRRTDEYGGSIENRSRFLLELIDAVSAVVPASTIGVRLSPSSTWMDAVDEDKSALHRYALSALSGRGLAYVHLVEPEIAGSTTADITEDAVPTAELAQLVDAPVIATGGHDAASAERLLAEGIADLVGFGRLFIANPDLPERIAAGAPLNSHDRRTFYAGGVEGYLTYPSLVEERRWEVMMDRISEGDIDPEVLAHSLAARDPVRLAQEGFLHASRQFQTVLNLPEGK